MNKDFDCVAFKHAAAVRIRQEIKKLGKDQELVFWKRRGTTLRSSQRKKM